MDRRSVAVVLPAYDELENLRVLLPELCRVFEAHPEFDWSATVVLPTHASELDTAELSGLGAIVRLRGPSDSFGDAIRTGIGTVDSSVDFVVFMDADGSHSPASIPHLLAHAESNDVVVASRYVRGGQSDNGPVLRAMSRSLNLSFRLVLGIHCSDVSTNFKLYRREQLQAIALTCDKFDIVEEILFRLQRQVGKESFRIHEVPDFFHERRFGQSKRQLGPFVASYVLTLVRLRMASSADTAK